MTTYNVQGPDGKTYQLEGPENASEADIISAAEELLGSKTAGSQQPEEEYEGFLQEVGEGIVSGLIAIPQGIAELGTSLVDVVFDTDYTQSVTDFAESVRAAGGIDPTGAAGEIAEVFTQFAVPGLGAASAVSKARVLAKAPIWLKGAAQVGAAGVTDAIVATNGTTTLGDFFEGGPTQTTDLIGLEGREKAMAAITNRLKLGFEAAGATGLASSAIKGLGYVGEGAMSVVGRSELTGKAARQTLRAGTFLSSKARSGLETLFTAAGKDGEQAVDSFLSVFRSRGNLSQDVFEERSAMRGKIEAELKEASSIKKMLDKNLDKIYKNTEEVMVNATPLTRAELNNRLYGFLTEDDAFVKEAAEQGIAQIDMLPTFMKPLAANMRKQVDDLSKKIEKGGYLTKKGKEESVEILKQNIGSYLRRKYKIFEDSGYLKTKEYRQGREEVIQVLKRSPELAGKIFYRTTGGPLPEDFIVGVGRSARLTNSAAAEITDSFVDSLTKRGGSVRGTVTTRTAIDKLQTSLFKERTLSAPAFKRLLGEVKDPQQAYISTVNDLATFSATDDFLSYIASQAGAKGDLLTQGAASRLPKNILEQDYKLLEDEYWGAAQGMFVSNRTYKDLTRLVVGDMTTMGNLALSAYSGFLRSKGVTQFAKTVLSPITQIRNVTSAGLFALAQGNIGRGANLFESIANVAGGISKRPDAMEYYTNLQRLGVINTQSELREIDRLMKEGLGIAQEADKTIAGIPVGDKVGGLFSQGKVAKALTGAKDMYQAGDDIWKIYNFEFEKGKLISKFGSAAKAKKAIVDAKLGRNLDEYAANIVKNTVPNYERVPELVKSLRKLPLGNFIAFPAEILRTSANTLSQAMKELASTSPELRAIGMRRLTGLVATTTIVPTALQGTAMALSGVTSEQMDAVRRSAQPWARDHTLIPTSTDKDGNVTGYMDYSYTNPYDYLAAPVRSIYNAVKDGRDLGKDPESIAFDAVYGSMASLFEPFLGESIITEKLQDISTRGGETKTGAKVFRPDDTAGTKMYKSFAHVVDAFAPGALDLAVELKPQKKSTQMPGFETGRLFRSFTNNNVDPAGNERKAVSEFMRMMTGITEVEVNPENIVMYSSYDYRENTTSAKQIFNTSVRTKSALDPADALATYRSANESLYRTQSKMYQVVEDMRALGRTDAEIRQALSKYNISDIGRLMRGQFVPMNISDQVRTDVRKNGNKLPLSELNDIRIEYRNKPLGGVEPEPEAPAAPTVDLGPSTPAPAAPAVISQPAQPAAQTLTPQPATAAAAKPIDPSLLGSNPMSIMKNLQIAQGTK